jgi:hypothetical protein
LKYLEIIGKLIANSIRHKETLGFEFSNAINKIFYD